MKAQYVVYTDFGVGVWVRAGGGGAGAGEEGGRERERQEIELQFLLLVPKEKLTKRLIAIGRVRRSQGERGRGGVGWGRWEEKSE
jgi:hypothetical protein